MTFFSRRNASLALSLAAVGVLAACGDDVTVPVVITPVTVSITPQAVTLNPGASATLSVQIAGGDPTPTLASCTSGATGVATATVSGNGCTVTAVASGSTTITATTSAGQSASAAVSVNALPSALGTLTVSPAMANLSGGQTVQLVPNANAAGSGVNVTYAYASSNSGIASVNANGVVTAATQGVATITVTATGTGTGFASATRTYGVTINVVSAPSAISGLTATPSSLSLATATSGQVAASVAQPTGAPAASISFGTTNPAVATVTVNSGNPNAATVTGVSAGTATITVTATAPAATGYAASTLTQLISVTVAPSAQVAIGNITTGLTNTPVDITNVMNQIQVALNITSNGQTVQSAQVWVCEPAEDTPTCAARTSNVPAAQQTFGPGGANDGTINTFINTAEFNVASDWSSATTSFKNGQKVLVATLTVAGQSAIASNNKAILNFNNVDNFAARHVAPTNTALSTNTPTNLTWYGGPGTTGQGSATIVPVFYSAGRTVIGATANLTGTACASTAVTFTGAGPWTLTYGAGTTAGTFIGCAGASTLGTNNVGDLGINVASAIDAQQNSVVIPATFATSTSNTPAVTLPAIIRGDYVGPTFTVTKPATNWASGAVVPAYSFLTATSTPTDVGVGPLAKSLSTYTYTYTGCNTTAGAMSTATAADIPECSAVVNSTSDVYVVTANSADLLGNTGTASTPSTVGNRFGIDNTAPAIRYTASSDSLVVYAAAPAVGTAADTMYSAEALDERSGFDAGAAKHLLSRSSQLLNVGSCVVGTAPVGATFNTAPTCATATAAFTGTTLPDGYRPIAPVVYSAAPVAGAEGYYTYRVQVQDRAGNVTTLSNRQSLINTSTPLITGLGIPGTIVSNATLNFTPNFTENVEAYFTNFRVSYNGLLDQTGAAEASLLFPATLKDARFNDFIFLNGNVTVKTPFTSGTQFYTNIELTEASGLVTNAPSTVIRPDSVGANVYNAGVIPSGVFSVNLLDGNIAQDTARWFTKNPNIIGFTLGTDASAWNAAANGLKAVVTANSNQLNSPFTRVDFYEWIGSAAPVGNWRFLGSVDATSAPSVSPAGAGPVYIADNGSTRVWTYRLTTAQCDSVSVGCTPAALTGAVAGRQFIAVASNGTAGRVLSTSTESSTYLASAPSSWTVAPTYAPAAGPVSQPQGTTNAAAIVITDPTYAPANAFGSPAAAVYSCSSSNTAVATCSVVGNNVSVTILAGADVLAPNTSTITVFASSAATAGFAGAANSSSYTFTATP